MCVCVCVTAAVNRVSAVMSRACAPAHAHTNAHGTLLRTATLSAVCPRPGATGVQEKVYVGSLEEALTREVGFNLKARILGPNGLYLQHIARETGSTLCLRGRGSGTLEPESMREAWEPLQIYIMYATLIFHPSTPTFHAPQRPHFTPPNAHISPPLNAHISPPLLFFHFMGIATCSIEL